MVTSTLTGPPAGSLCHDVHRHRVEIADEHVRHSLRRVVAEEIRRVGRDRRPHVRPAGCAHVAPIGKPSAGASLSRASVAGPYCPSAGDGVARVVLVPELLEGDHVDAAVIEAPSPAPRSRSGPGSLGRTRRSRAPRARSSTPRTPRRRTRGRSRGSTCRATPRADAAAPGLIPGGYARKYCWATVRSIELTVMCIPLSSVAATNASFAAARGRRRRSTRRRRSAAPARDERAGALQLPWATICSPAPSPLSSNSSRSRLRRRSGPAARGRPARRAARSRIRLAATRLTWETTAGASKRRSLTRIPPRPRRQSPAALPAEVGVRSR